MQNRRATLFWGWYTRWVGAIFLGVLLCLYILKQLGAIRIFSLIGLLVLCVVIALGAIATALGFYSETRLLGRAHRREHSPARLILQWMLFGVALLVLLATVVAFVILAAGVITEMGHQRE